MARNRLQFFLADLIALIAVSGLSLALVRSIDQLASAIGIGLLIWLIVFAWKLFRLKREAPTCDECGRQ